MSDYYNIIDTAVEAAEKRAFTKGREEGREETIAKLLAAGFDKEAVAKALSVSVEELHKD